MMNDIRSQLFNLCVDIYAHAQLDWEWTNSWGNGTNCSEAYNVAQDIIGILGNVMESEIDEAVNKRIAELESE